MFAFVLSAFLATAPAPDYMAPLTMALPLDEACGPAGRLRFGMPGTPPVVTPRLDFSQPTNSQYLGTLA